MQDQSKNWAGYKSKKRRKKRNDFNPNSETVRKETEHFLKKGGNITVIIKIDETEEIKEKGIDQGSIDDFLCGSPDLAFCKNSALFI